MNVLFRTAASMVRALAGLAGRELLPIPGLPYIVFPGNVGGPSSLNELYASLQAELGRRRPTAPDVGQ